MSWGSKVGLVGSLLFAEVGFLVGAGARARRPAASCTEEQIITVSLIVHGRGRLLTAVMSDLGRRVR